MKPKYLIGNQSAFKHIWMIKVEGGRALSYSYGRINPIDMDEVGDSIAQGSWVITTDEELIQSIYEVNNRQREIFDEMKVIDGKVQALNDRREELRLQARKVANT